MKDTDYRPSPCPYCGKMRAAAKKPKCTSVDCQLAEYVKLANKKESADMTYSYKPSLEPYVWREGAKPTRSVKTNTRYLWIRPMSSESSMAIVDDLSALYRGSQFDEKTDKLYELGPEVKIEVKITTVPAESLTRGYGDSHED